jgi:hypothetical protein
VISNDNEMKNKILEARARFPFHIGLSACSKGAKGQRTGFPSVLLSYVCIARAIYVCIDARAPHAKLPIMPYLELPRMPCLHSGRIVQSTSRLYSGRIVQVPSHLSGGPFLPESKVSCHLTRDD